MAVVVCWLAYPQFQRLKLDAYREWSCRDNISLSIHSLFILIGRETKSWPHQNTRLSLSRCLRYLCFVNLAEMVFYREGLLSGIPRERGLRSELLQRSKGCASRPRPQLRGVVFFFCWEMRNTTSETLFHFKSISLKYLLSGYWQIACFKARYPVQIVITISQLQSLIRFPLSSVYLKQFFLWL